MLHVLRFSCHVSRISPFVAVSSLAASLMVTMSYGLIVQYMSLIVTPRCARSSFATS